MDGTDSIVGERGIMMPIMSMIKGSKQSKEWIKNRTESRNRFLASHPDFYKSFWTGHRQTRKTRVLISKRQKEHFKKNPKAREFLRKLHMGKIQDAASNLKRSLTLKDRVFTKSHRKNLRRAAIAGWREGRIKGKPKGTKSHFSEDAKQRLRKHISKFHKKRSGVYIDCLNCGASFYRPPCYANRAGYCTRACKDKSQQGKPPHGMVMEKHWNWKGGITSENTRLRNDPQYKLWRKTIFERDHFTCLVCGQVGGELNADHIKSFSKFPLLRYDISNGATLCVGCHYLKTWQRKKGG